MNEMNPALVLLTASLFFALVIERALEVLQRIYDYVEAKNDLRGFWNRRAQSIRERLQHRVDQTKENRLQGSVIRYLATNYLSEDHPGYQGIPVISAESVRVITVRGINKTVGAVVGILVAFSLHINVFDLIERAVGTTSAEDMGILFTSLPEWIEYSITGFMLGLGSGPMHKFIMALESARKKRRTTESA